MKHFDGYHWRHKHTKPKLKASTGTTFGRNQGERLGKKQVTNKVEVDRVAPQAYPKSGAGFKVSKF